MVACAVVVAHHGRRVAVAELLRTEGNAGRLIELEDDVSLVPLAYCNACRTEWCIADVGNCGRSAGQRER
jgi:hypothetical protein